MRVLVTGGAGYIGSVTAHLLIERGHQVVILDDLSTGHLDAIPAGAEFIEGSILDPEAVARFMPSINAAEPSRLTLQYKSGFSIDSPTSDLPAKCITATTSERARATASGSRMEPSMNSAPAGIALR